MEGTTNFDVEQYLGYLKYLNVLNIIGEPIEKFAGDVLGFSAIQARFIMGLFLSLPLGLCFRFFVYKVPRAARSWISLLTGFQIMWFIYGSQTLFLVLCAIVTYLIMKLMPISYSYIVAFVFNVGYMVASHIYIMTTAYMSWEPDYTAPLMVLTIKLTSYAFSVHDAYYHNHLLSEAKKETPEGSPAPVELTPRQLRYMVEEQPGLVDFFGWVFFFSGFFGGPAVEYMDYKRYTEGTMVDGDMKFKIPSCWKDGLLVFAECLVAMFLIGFFGAYDMSNVRNKLADDDVAATLPFWKRYLILTLGAFLQRCKYYTVWLMGELASRCCGIGFSGMVKDKQTGELVASWENAVNIIPLKFEFPMNMKEAVDVWNMATERWLRYYCFERLAHTPLAKWKRDLTFIFSAFWHGVYPAYYMTFGSAALVLRVSRSCRQKLRPYVQEASKTRPFIQHFYDIFGILCVIVSLNPLFCCFGMLSAGDAFHVFKNTYFCGYWLLILGLIVLPFIPSKKPAAEAKQKTQ